MQRRFKKKWKEFQGSPPGERFKASYERRRQTGEPTTLWRVLNIAMAVVAFVLGVVFSLIPGVPGFVFFFVCGILLASESLLVARFLDRVDLKLRAAWARIARRRQKVPGHP